jgi:alkaline phosphatase
MMRIRILPVVAMLILLLSSCGEDVKIDADVSIEVVKKPKRIIFLIGDGMGTSQMSSAYFYSENEPNFSRMPVTGFIKTSSTSKITDSAAGATAFSCGKKTYNGALGVDADTSRVENITERLKKSIPGISVGLVATSSITHATPAAYYAHIDSRQKAEEIMLQLATSQVDFFAGGGKNYVFDRSDSIDALAEFMKAGFDVDTSAMLKKDWEAGKRYGYLLASDGMPEAPIRDNFLMKGSLAAIEYLARSESSFLMIEGSQIDWAGHSNDGEWLKDEVLDFDAVLGSVLDWAEKDGETLVVVTADHETGGYSLSAYISEDGMSGSYDTIVPSFSTLGHSATLVPVLAYGPGSEAFMGIYENTAIFHKMVDAIE